MKRLLCLLGCAALLAPHSAFAEAELPFDVERIRDKSDVEIDPASAYILVETDLFGDIEFVKEATPAEQEAWEQARLQALAAADASETTQGSDNADFPWPAAESQLRLQIGALKHFERKRDFVLYLYRVPAGTYTFYAHNSYNTRDCACMGSVSFPVSAGTITALRIEREYVGPDGEVLAERPRKGTALERLMRTGLQVSAPTALSNDERLPREMITPAMLSGVPEVPNWGRYIINRVLPIEGLFHYDRAAMVIEDADQPTS